MEASRLLAGYCYGATGPAAKLDELGRPRWGGPDNKKGPDESTTRLTLPGQDDPPARVDEPPVEVPLQGSSPEGRGCAIA